MQQALASAKLLTAEGHNQELEQQEEHKVVEEEEGHTVEVAEDNLELEQQEHRSQEPMAEENNIGSVNKENQYINKNSFTNKNPFHTLFITIIAKIAKIKVILDILRSTDKSVALTVLSRLQVL